MNILVATDGTLDPVRAADAVERWYDDGDEVIVFTAVNFPSDFLHRLGESGVQEAADIAREAGFGLGQASSAKLASEHKVSPKSLPAESDAVTSVLAATAEGRTGGIVEALAERGVPAKALWRATENKTAHTIMQTMRSHDCELVIVGSHGHGRFEGLLGSTGTKLVRHAPASVLVIRGLSEA